MLAALDEDSSTWGRERFRERLVQLRLGRLWPDEEDELVPDDSASLSPFERESPVAELMYLV